MEKAAHMISWVLVLSISCGGLRSGQSSGNLGYRSS